jgi:Na+-driven multidrug efflux pump
LVSNVIGQRKEGLIGSLMRRAVSLAYLTTLPLAAVALLAPERVLAVFTSDRAVVDACVNSLRLISCGLLIIVPGQMFASAVAGTGDTPAALGIEFLATTGALLCTYGALLWLELPMEYAWLAEVLGGLSCLALGYGWLRGRAWKRLRL